MGRVGKVQSSIGQRSKFNVVSSKFNSIQSGPFKVQFKVQSGPSQKRYNELMKTAPPGIFFNFSAILLLIFEGGRTSISGEHNSVQCSIRTSSMFNPTSSMFISIQSSIQSNPGVGVSEWAGPARALPPIVTLLVAWFLASNAAKFEALCRGKPQLHGADS